MHEISLVQSMIGQLHDLVQENNASKITKITMDIGSLSGVVVDSFRFGYEVLSEKDDVVRGAELVIVSLPATYRCTRCDHTEETTDKPDCCPQCQEIFLVPEGGDELILRQVEME
jgi:hydrogenase nickel incorporation protein HypA/HybF